MKFTAQRLFNSLLHYVLALAFLLVANGAGAQAISNTPTIQIGGRINFISTGGSLRTQSDSGNSCLVATTSSQALSGIPVGATVRAAYLYWGGSGSTTDSSVTLNGNTVNASRTFASTYNNGGTLLSFFGGFANVTSLITGNATMTFGSLAVNTGGDYCTSSAVLAGWGLVVIYEHVATQPYRVINIFDGLQNFRGNSLTLTPTGFRIPSGSVDGKISVITWEGDPGNSTALNGFSESLTFNGNPLDDGINVANSNPTVQQFDGTVNTLNVATTYGVDVDTYDVTSLVSAGQTNATTVYSAGGDLVLLTSQIVSVTSEPLIDLSITKSHAGNFSVGTNGTYTLQVANGSGLEPVNYPITVTDTLPTGLTYVSGTGTGWSCSAAAQVVTCVHNGPLASGASLPAITLTVAVGNAAFPGVTNTATVSAPSTVETNSANNSVSDATTVLGPNISTSQKTVVDLNAGDANPGDTLRYTITINETAGVAGSGISVTDHIPGNTSGFSVVSIPAGATNGSTGAGTGNNSAGLLTITNISLPANGSVTIVFDVQVAALASPGATIANTAAVNNPAGTDPTPSSPTLIVSQSQIPGSGTKQLYVWSNGGNVLSRARPTGTHNAVTIGGAGASTTWQITPALALPVTLQAGAFPVRLLIDNSGTSLTNSRNVTVRLDNSVLGLIGTATLNQEFDDAALTAFNMNLGASVIAPAGSFFTLQITNNTTSSTRSVNITPYSAAGYSRVDLNSATVIKVESINTYDATYAGGVTTTSFMRGLNTVYMRAVVSDPFGSFDISSANVSLVNPSNVTIGPNAMTQVASAASTKTYEFAYAIPANAVAGAWSIRVTANEGVEGVNDLGVGQFTVTIPMPTLLISKISQVISDPVNGATNPKSIPGSTQRYTITVTNSGPGAVDASTLAIADVLPTTVTLYVATGSGDPVLFTNGITPSGLSYTYATSVTYSNQPGGGLPFSYTPVPDADGFDNAITGVRIVPSGTMSAASGGNQPSFTLQFRVKVK